MLMMMNVHKIILSSNCSFFRKHEDKVTRFHSYKALTPLKSNVKEGLELKSSWCRVDNMKQNILLQHEIDKTFPLVNIYGLIDSSLQFSKNCIRLRIEFSSIYKFFLQPANILRLYIFCVNKLLIYQQTLHADVSFKF